MEKLNFTTILHSPRSQLGITINEYCVADLIYNLSKNGWCYATREYIADCLSLDRRSVTNLTQKLIDKGLMEKDPETKYLRTTDLWYNTIILESDKEKSSQERGKKVPTGREKSSHYYNNKYISISHSKTFVLQASQVNELISLFAEVNPLYEELYKRKTERQALEDLAAKIGYEKLKRTIEALPEVIARPYAPKITKPSELKRNLAKLITFYKQESNKKTKTLIL
jgi:hypothetical protein